MPVAGRCTLAVVCSPKRHACSTARRHATWRAVALTAHTQRVEEEGEAKHREEHLVGGPVGAGEEAGGHKHDEHGEPARRQGGERSAHLGRDALAPLQLSRAHGGHRARHLLLPHLLPHLRPMTSATYPNASMPTMTASLKRGAREAKL